jgi:hypothetical protein
MYNSREIVALEKATKTQSQGDHSDVSQERSEGIPGVARRAFAFTTPGPGPAAGCPAPLFQQERNPLEALAKRNPRGVHNYFKRHKLCIKGSL